MIKYMTDDNKNMSNGMRDFSGTPLKAEEIKFIKTEIKRIGADISVFIFNDEEHLRTSTCYNFVDDCIYVTRNVFPDMKYGYTEGEKNIAYDVTPITYVSEKGEKGITGVRNNDSDMSKMRNVSRDYYNIER